MSEKKPIKKKECVLIVSREDERFELNITDTINEEEINAIIDSLLAHRDNRHKPKFLH